ncbi:hypothetical protein l11_21570 [Neisseria weaveri LMG 5135]|nr:hypothetical protein l11_21570 [Neisseria weaveri LMG 5135]
MLPLAYGRAEVTRILRGFMICVGKVVNIAADYSVFQTAFVCGRPSENHKGV